MSTTILILGGVAALLVALYVVRLLVMRRLTRQMLAWISANFSDDEIVRAEPTANFFGVASQGMTQWRGNGALVLGRETFAFRLFAPSRELVVDLEDIKLAGGRRSFLSKTTFRPLLWISFETEHGVDEAAFVVKDLQGWLADLSGLGVRVTRVDSGTAQA
jgi:hypothetical protein